MLIRSEPSLYLNLDYETMYLFVNIRQIMVSFLFPTAFRGEVLVCELR